MESKGREQAIAGRGESIQSIEAARARFLLAKAAGEPWVERARARVRALDREMETRELRERFEALRKRRTAPSGPRGPRRPAA